MRRARNRLRGLSHAAAPALVALCLGAPLAWAAAPPATGTEADRIDPPTIHELDTEIVVHNWVLCVSRVFAEQLARAREAGVEEAHSAYADLARSRACGQVEELYVVLRRRLYASPQGSDHDTRVFEAEIRLSDNWAAAFIVYGGLGDDRR